jgi:hypothetical protein
MPAPTKEEVYNILNKYKERLSKELNVSPETIEASGKQIYSREYADFRREYLPKPLSYYEKACYYSEKILKIKPDKKEIPILQESISISHLNMTPSGSASFSILAPLLLALIGSLVSFAIFNSMFFVMVFVVAGLALYLPLKGLPNFIANNWRMKASNQMVLCIFYVVTFMRHTSNIELAIQFAAEHISPPLALDLKKVLWDVETEKYESVKESLDIYLETWRKWNMEFVEAFHLIESSLFEPSESRRLDLLDKSLDVILTETYEKMLHYAHNLKSPITMLHMLGIILPILGLVILPLVVNFLGEVKWYHIATLYNVILPIGVYFLGMTILAKRPTGYGDTDISESNPGLKKYRNIIIRFAGLEMQIDPMIVSVVLCISLLFIGFSPIMMHWFITSEEGFGFGEQDDLTPCKLKYCILEYKTNQDTGAVTGPFGIGASVLSLFVTLGLGLPIGLYYRFKSKNIIKIREQTKKLEDEFASALYQLGNRLGDGLPAEIAFGKVAEVMQDSVSGNFFALVNANIRKMGLSVQEAIFNQKVGALVYFPSKIIESSMKVLIESIKKGPAVAAQALTNIARYIKEIHKVNERLKDLMGEVITSMKSQISFMTPAIAGIVIGITSMVTGILGSLSARLSLIATQSPGVSTQANIINMFGEGIPTYYFQIVVGLYVVQIAYILTILANGIENGADKLAERYSLGKNMITSTVLYCFISLVVMLIFTTIASKVLVATGT